MAPYPSCRLGLTQACIWGSGHIGRIWVSRVSQQPVPLKSPSLSLTTEQRGDGIDFIFGSSFWNHDTDHHLLQSFYSLKILPNNFLIISLFQETCEIACCFCLFFSPCRMLKISGTNFSFLSFFFLKSMYLFNNKYMLSHSVVSDSLLSNGL